MPRRYSLRDVEMAVHKAIARDSMKVVSDPCVRLISVDYNVD